MQAQCDIRKYIFESAFLRISLTNNICNTGASTDTIHTEAGLPPIQTQ